MEQNKEKLQHLQTFALKLTNGKEVDVRQYINPEIQEGEDGDGFIQVVYDYDETRYTKEELEEIKQQLLLFHEKFSEEVIKSLEDFLKKRYEPIDEKEGE